MIIGYNHASEGTYVRGVAPDAKIVMLRVNGNTDGSPTQAAALFNSWEDAIGYAILLHLSSLSDYNMIISISLSIDPTEVNTVEEVNALNALEIKINKARFGQGIPVICANGNAGAYELDGESWTEYDETTYPALFNASTSVAGAKWNSLSSGGGFTGALTDIEENWNELALYDDSLPLSGSSNNGKVEFTGVAQNLFIPYGYNVGSGTIFQERSGTSFACPQIAGVFALLFEIYGSQSVDWLEEKIAENCYWNSNYMDQTFWGSGFVRVDLL